MEAHALTIFVGMLAIAGMLLVFRDLLSQQSCEERGCNKRRDDLFRLRAEDFF